jgi:2-methylcitrate dehydratase
MATITRTISDWACNVQYDDLPPEVVHEAKRYLMDSVGCALGGAQQHDVHIAREVLNETAGSGNCRIMVTGELWDPVSASLLNALMIRVMDYNDIYWKQDPSHPSDLIPAAMAAAERAGGSGRDLIVGTTQPSPRLRHRLPPPGCSASTPSRCSTLSASRLRATARRAR